MKFNLKFLSALLCLLLVGCADYEVVTVVPEESQDRAKDLYISVYNQTIIRSGGVYATEQARTAVREVYGKKYIIYKDGRKQLVE